MVTEPPEKPDKHIGGAETQSFKLTKLFRINVKGEHVSIQTMHLRPLKLIMNAGQHAEIGNEKHDWLK
ncbi:hypothetical protein DERF_003629 [Dermatophagoides farinae]|uniref:Uncharacterized protein n=1 Tax=Dermatophagoides farinae TaxID=6954 RepID=A0A922ICY8_DERFA|nr:hypothetical protein DERF_003629 [Dermatophagoides farinae]